MAIAKRTAFEMKVASLLEAWENLSLKPAHETV